MLKTCTSCLNEKNLSDFRKDRNTKTGYQSHCKLCARTFHRSQYQVKYADKYKINGQKRRDLFAQFVAAIRNTNPCQCCGETSHCCLQFHHVDPSNKDFMLTANREGNPKRNTAEIEKCVSVCANCHMKIHAGEIECPTETLRVEHIRVLVYGS